MTTYIHPTAIVEKGAELDSNVEIGAFSYIGPHVRLHKGVQVARHASIEGDSEIGAETKIFSHAKIGVRPQDLKYDGEPGRVVLGKRNMVREGAGIEIGTRGGGMLTQIGDDCLLMINSHIAHDVLVGDHLVIGMCACVAGHVAIGSHVRISALSGIHQHVRIGDHAFIGPSVVINRDILPYVMIDQHGHLIGVNIRGLRKRGFDNKTIGQLQHIYTTLLCDTEESFVTRLAALVDEREQYSAEAVKMLDFALVKSNQGYLVDQHDKT